MTTAFAPRILANAAGLRISLNANGSVQRIDHDTVMLNLYLGSEVESGPANIYLRIAGAVPTAVPLLGPRSPSLIEDLATGFAVHGSWHTLDYRVVLVLAPTTLTWCWQITLKNTGAAPVTCDLVLAQDLGLAHYGFIRTNEFFVSQYLDHTPLMHPRYGRVVAVRQNLAIGGRHPWCAFGALGGGASYATDALQFHGLAGRRGALPQALIDGLPDCRLQHEHALVALADTPLTLAPGQRSSRGFFACFAPDHPTATGADDVALIDAALASAATWLQPSAPAPRAAAPATTLFTSAPLFACTPWHEADVAAHYGTLQLPEYHAGQLFAGFASGDTHIVLAAKELAVQRAHAQILRSGAALVPDEAALTTTVWMGGMFNSMLTQGHVGINRLLSSSRGYLGLFRAPGQRIFIDYGDGWQLLDLPSAWACAPGAVRWHYANAACALEISTIAQADTHAIDVRIVVTRGQPARFLCTQHIALDDDDAGRGLPLEYRVDAHGVYLHPQAQSALGTRFGRRGFRIAPHGDTTFMRCSGAECLFSDQQAHGESFLCIELAATRAAGMTLTGDLLDAAAIAPELLATTANLCAELVLTLPTDSPARADLARWSAILPWFADNALVHYLAPRGLEQFTGGGWGTRDICQGPLELLLALGQLAPARDLLLRVFGAQNSAGDWPQWFSFFERERHIRASDAHGDIVFWPLLALARYLETSGDAGLLDAVVPFYSAADAAPASANVWAHAERALAYIRTQIIGDTALVAYGHGDWNDSMQPADPRLREELCSSWTVTLHHLMLTTLAGALERCGRAGPVADLRAWAATVGAAFQDLLVIDEVVPGYAHFHANGQRDYLLHPRDALTGVQYSLLPLPHALLTGLLNPDQAAHHLQLIRTHLTGPDGARLFDRPLRYRGGVEHLFQRAETAAFFGREIGLMYTHAHLRYAEALALVGRAEEFFAALNLVNPIDLDQRLPGATPRQANCYYSSSDAAFPDRYAAYANYAQIAASGMAFDGGWRVYSSGPGLAIAILVRCLFGLRRAGAGLIIDPVLPRALDGLTVTYPIDGLPCRFSYRVGAYGYGVRSVHLNGIEVSGVRLANPYRTGGVEIALAPLRPLLAQARNEWLITLE